VSTTLIAVEKAVFLFKAPIVGGTSPLHTQRPPGPPELGELQIAEALLRAGAFPHPEAQGLTPGALAEKEGHKAIAELLNRN